MPSLLTCVLAMALCFVCILTFGIVFCAIACLVQWLADRVKEWCSEDG